MSEVNQNNGYGQQQAAGASGPTAILNKCKEINNGIQELRAKRESQLAAAQNALLDSSTGKEDQATRQTLDYIEDEINRTFRYLRDLLQKVKNTPGSGDARVQTQIDVTSKNLQREIQQYQKTQSDFQKRLISLFSSGFVGLYASTPKVAAITVLPALILGGLRRIAGFITCPD